MPVNLSAIIITIIGVISSLYTGVINANLPKKIKNKKREEMIMFYWRFILDVVFAVFAAPFLSFSILYTMYPEHLRYFHNLIFYLALPASNVGAIRSIITLAITLDRDVAAYFPIKYHNYRPYFPMQSILAFAIAFGLAEHVVLFGFCNFHLDLPYNCAALGCSVNACFLTYWTTHKTIVFALILVFSMFLCIKLFLLNRIGGGDSGLTRVNRLALIDAGNVCLFDFLPSVLANQFSQTPFFSFQNLGPYTAVTKSLGCAFEAYLVFRTFSRSNTGTKPSESSVTHRKTKGDRVTTFPVVTNGL